MDLRRIRETADRVRLVWVVICVETASGSSDPRRIRETADRVRLVWFVIRFRSMTFIACIIVFVDFM